MRRCSTHLHGVLQWIGWCTVGFWIADMLLSFVTGVRDVDELVMGSGR